MTIRFKERTKTPKERAFSLGCAMVNAIGFQGISTGDIEDCSNAAVEFVNNYLGSDEQQTSVDELTARLGAEFAINDWD